MVIQRVSANNDYTKNYDIDKEPTQLVSTISKLACLLRYCEDVKRDRDVDNMSNARSVKKVDEISCC